MENSTAPPAPRSKTLEFLKRFARECPMQAVPHAEKIIVLQISDLERLGSC